MANIQPNTIIRLLHNVPLDNKYTDTLFWETASHQHANMLSLTKYTFTEQTYQRVNRNRLRVQRCADDIYDCNYLMFQNTAFGNKWFYAFITKVEYINNITSEIEYEIDDMQTWLFDYTLTPCFVEREHIANDDISNRDLIKSEPIDTGEIIKYDISKLKEFEYCVVVSYLPWGTQTGSGSLVGDYMYSGCNYACFKMPDQVQLLSDFIDTFVSGNAENYILDICMMPYDYAYETHTIQSFAEVERPTTIGDYQPRNNKLLYYPYTFLNVDTGTDSRNYKFELFLPSRVATFTIAGYQTNNPSVSVYPIMYNNRSQGTRINPTEKVTMTGFPHLSWRADGFSSSFVPNTLNLPYSAVMAGVNMQPSIALQAFQQSVMEWVYPTSSKFNGTNSSDVDIAMNIKHIYYAICGITEERARQIDSFFDRYGYACEEIKVPNRNVRESWTYCKTRDCNIVGSIPVDSMANIKNIYNKGITWWKTIGSVGNYLLSNRTLSQIENESE